MKLKWPMKVHSNTFADCRFWVTKISAKPLLYPQETVKKKKKREYPIKYSTLQLIPMHINTNIS